jgi:AraC-like DNA-binding protein
VNHRRERLSDSTSVERISLVEYDEATSEWMTPDGCWDLVIMRKAGQTLVLQTGVISRPVQIDNVAGDSYLAISFKPGVFVPTLPGSKTVNRGVAHPLATQHAFVMQNETLELPTFENAEGLVDRLVRRGVLATDDLVETAAAGRPRAISPRSMQRHFLTALGVTPKQFSQIKRAGAAVELLRTGITPVQVAIDLGYSDQAHLTRSLKTIMGQTPGEIAKAAASVHAKTTAKPRR